MSDLISRADAIEAVRKKLQDWGSYAFEDYRRGLYEAQDIIEALPSAEPHNKDAISREGLLRSWEELSPRGRLEFDQVIMTIPALPSADAEPKITKVRKDGTLFITVLDAEKVKKVFVNDLQGFYNTFCEEPKQDDDNDYDSLVPDEYKTEPSDLISRADAICEVLVNDGIDNIVDRINALPSADAVQGEWEHWGSPFSDESEVIDTIVCSVCGARFIEPKDEPKGEYNFCPNCGAKMGGDGE